MSCHRPLTPHMALQQEGDYLLLPVHPGGGPQQLVVDGAGVVQRHSRAVQLRGLGDADRDCVGAL